MPTFEDFIHDTPHEFIDISSELERTYTFDGNTSVTIISPVALHVSKSGGHRILDRSGTAHYIPNTWIHLTWEVTEGSPHFVL